MLRDDSSHISLYRLELAAIYAYIYAIESYEAQPYAIAIFTE